MKEYKLRVLMLTSNNSSRYEQYEMFTVKADGLRLIGDGRVYEFYRTETTSENKKIFPTIACYPTQYTIIDNIQEHES